MKKINPKRYVTFLRDYVVVIPATTLESTDMKTGAPYVIAEIPESRQEYREGQVIQFGSVNAAREFVKALNTESDSEVCFQGIR